MLQEDLGLPGENHKLEPITNYNYKILQGTGEILCNCDMLKGAPLHNVIPVFRSFAPNVNTFWKLLKRQLWH